jgi:hypothetical protein
MRGGPKVVTGELVSTGIAEIEWDGFVRRGLYSTNGAKVVVTYSGLRKEAQLKGPVTAYATARTLLRDLLAETNAH